MQVPAHRQVICLLFSYFSKNYLISNGYGSGLLIQSGQNKNGHLLALGSSLALVAGVRACIRLCNCVGCIHPGVLDMLW